MRNLKRFAPIGKRLKQSAALYITCFNAPDKGENWTMESATAYMQGLVDKSALFWGVFDAQDELIGLAIACPSKHSNIAQEAPGLSKDGIYIALLTIRPDHQRQGLGTAIREGVIQELRGLGTPQLIARCRADNTGMIKLNQRQGFELVRRYSAKMGGVICERVIWALDLR